MSVIAPISVSAPTNMQTREPASLVAAANTRAAPAVSASLTQAAVQQAKSASRAEVLTTRDIVPIIDRRNRLVGPPPTFDVNMLQHIRETRNDPRDDDTSPAETERAAAAIAEDANESAPEMADTARKPEVAGSVYQQLDAQEPTSPRTEMFDKRL